MKMNIFNKMSEKYPTNPEVGQVFLVGENMIGQKYNKKSGDTISYYKVIKVKNNNDYEYVTNFEKLE